MAEIAYQDQDVIVEAYLGLGRMGNNCYVLRPTSDGPVTIVDAPEGIEEVINALGGAAIERTVVTHSHFDHWLGFEVLGTVTDAPVYVGADEANLEPSWNARPLDDGETFSVGDAQVQVIATPGHTPGSICLLVGKAVLTGDTLFKNSVGGVRAPGSTSYEDLRSSILDCWMPPPEEHLPMTDAERSVILEWIRCDMPEDGSVQTAD